MTVADEISDRPSQRRKRGSGIRARDGNGRAIRSLETIAQDLEAARLRSMSLTERQIAARLNLDPGGVHRAIERGYAAIPTEDDVAAKRNELDKLNRIERVLLSILTKPAPKVDHGHVVIDESTGEPVPDRTLSVAAANALRAVTAERSKLRGLYPAAASRAEEFSHEAFMAEFKRLESEVAAMDAEQQPKETDAP